MAKIRTILGIDPGTNILGFGVIRLDDHSGKPEYLGMGVLDLRKESDPYEKLAVINRRVGELCEEYSVTDLAVESPFYGKNAQVIFKLGRAQGSAIIAAKLRGVSIYEYAPRKAKIAICGNGAASKEQVAMMVEKTLEIDVEAKYLDATDALAIAMCHYYQLTNPMTSTVAATSWEKFIAANPDRISHS